jgi:hypothetical protein
MFYKIVGKKKSITKKKTSNLETIEINLIEIET